MPRYLVEVDFPGAGTLQPDELRAVSRRTRHSLDELAARVQWQHSYLAAERIFVVYIADDETLVRQHMTRAGLPAGRVSRITAVIDAATAEHDDTDARS